MKKTRILAALSLCLLSGGSQAATWNTAPWGFDTSASPNTIALHVGNSWLPIFTMTAGVPNIWRKEYQGSGANATATAFSASNQALWLSGTLTGSGQAPYGLFSITDTATNTVGGFVPGLWIAHNVGSGAGEGSRMALQPILTINNALPCASGGAYCYHIAAFPQIYVGANLGGTSGVGNSRGDVYGLGGLAQIGSGGTYIHGLTGAELNSSAQAGSSVDYKSVLTLISVNSDAVQGSLYDAMLGFTADNTTTAKWSYGVAFGRGDSTWPFNTSSTLIGSVAPGTGARTAANGVDFSGVTFSGCAFKSNLFCVSQGGATVSHVANNTYYSDKGAPQPSIVGLGDRVYQGTAVGANYSSNPPAGTFTWGTDYGADYIGRDAMHVIGQDAGGYGIAIYGRNSDFNNNPTNYKVSSGLGIFELCDTASGAITNLCGGTYVELLQLVSNAPAIGHETDIGNHAGKAPNVSPYSVNPPGAAVAYYASTSISKANMLVYDAGSAFAITAPISAYQRGLVIGANALYGTNNNGNCAISLNLTNGSSLATVSSLTCNDGVSRLALGTVVFDGRFSGGFAYVYATARDAVPIKVQLSANWTSTTGAATLTFSNQEGEAIDLAAGSTGDAIRWTNPNNAKGAFIRADLASTATSLGMIFTSTGLNFVDFTTTPGTETVNASLTPAGAFSAKNVTINDATALVKTGVSMNNGAAAATATLTNAPAAGNPTKWIPINDNGTTRYIPAW